MRASAIHEEYKLRMLVTNENPLRRVKNAPPSKLSPWKATASPQQAHSGILLGEGSQGGGDLRLPNTP